MHRSFKVCFAVTATLVLVTAIAFTTLAMTILKPKDPVVTAKPVGLENITFGNLTINVTLQMLVTINNPNYASFTYRNTTSFLDYHGMVVAEVPLEQDFVPARSTVRINASTNFMVDKLISSPFFLVDAAAGSFNFTSAAQLHGRASLLKIIRFKATVLNKCHISFYLDSKDVDSKCESKLHI